MAISGVCATVTVWQKGQVVDDLVEFHCNKFQGFLETNF